MSGIAGDPGVLRANAAGLGEAGAGMTEVATTVTDIAGTGSNVWNSPAARIFSGAAHLMGSHMSAAGRAFTQAAEALSVYATTLEVAQQEWDTAHAQLQQLEEQAHALSRRISAAIEENAQAQAAYTTADAQATANNTPAPTAPTLLDVGALQDELSGLNAQIAQCQERMREAEASVERAGNAAAQVINDAARLSPKYTVYHKPGWFSSLWHDVTGGVGWVFHQDEQFLLGAGQFVTGIADMVNMFDPLSLTNLEHPGQWVHTMEGMGKMLYSISVFNAIQNPSGWLKANETFLGSMVDVKDLRSGNYARWAGDILPQILLTVATVGGGAAASATADGASALAATADAAEAANAAGVAADGSAALGDAGGAAGAVHDIPPPLSGDNLPTSSLDQRYVGENSGDPKAPWGGKVHYMSPAETEAHRVFVDSGGLLRNASDGSLVDTGAAATAHTGEGQAIFVMDRSGNLYVSPEQVVGQLHHSSLLAGGDVAGAGEVKVENGVLKMLTDKSGHYQPPPEMNDRVLSTLQKQGLQLPSDFQRLGWW